MLKKRKRRCCGVVESGIHTWTHSVHVPRVYLEGKVELTYWDRSDRLVAFMYSPPVSACRAEMIPLPPFSSPLPAIYSPSPVDHFIYSRPIQRMIELNGEF